MRKGTVFSFRGKNDKLPFHYKECGLDDIYLVSGYEIEETPYGRGVSIKNLDELHKAIGLYLVKQKKTLSGQELRFLRKQMDLSQSDLGRLCNISAQQVARWEKEECSISGPADVLVRVYFLQHAGKDLNLRKLIEYLEKMDDSVNEKVSFENTPRGWKIKETA